MQDYTTYKATHTLVVVEGLISILISHYQNRFPLSKRLVSHLFRFHVHYVCYLK